MKDKAQGILLETHINYWLFANIIMAFETIGGSSIDL